MPSACLLLSLLMSCYNVFVLPQLTFLCTVKQKQKVFGCYTPHLCKISVKTAVLNLLLCLCCVVLDNKTGCFMCGLVCFYNCFQ